MSRFADLLISGNFVVTAEIAPPKGADATAALAVADKLHSVDAINITDNQGACMRMSPLALARLLIDRGFEPILQLTCRDRNRMALQSDILGAAALGVENLLLLTGDHPRFGDHTASRPVFDLDSVQLLQAVTQLQDGIDMAGNRLASIPRLFVGAAASPAADPQDLALKKVQKKIACGAQFFQTQAVFQRSRVELFMETAQTYRVPVILGVLLIKSPRMARFLNAQIPGVRVPDELLERLDNARDPLCEGIEIAREMVSWAREYCQGVHLMTFGREELIPEILG
ncbi:MAG: 5,10-methylenetetrahydrofolate reductase [Desulfuromonas sp.]|nr:MAG: 5,10-methylenetetrahydrofolate reductase [Desulfuromonas sp.]